MGDELDRLYRGHRVQPHKQVIVQRNERNRLQMWDSAVFRMKEASRPVRHTRLRSSAVAPRHERWRTNGLNSRPLQGRDSCLVGDAVSTWSPSTSASSSARRRPGALHHSLWSSRGAGSDGDHANPWPHRTGAPPTLPACASPCGTPGWRDTPARDPGTRHGRSGSPCGLGRWPYRQS